MSAQISAERKGCSTTRQPATSSASKASPPRASRRPLSRIAVPASSGAGPCRRAWSRALDQLDLVTVRIFQERDHAAPMLHRPRRARDLDALLRQPLAGAVDVGEPDREMTEAGADRIGLLLTPVVGELDHRVRAFVAIAHEDEGEFA